MKQAPSSKNSLTRFVSIFAGGTLLSRVLGLARDIALAAFIAGAAKEAFLFAFTLPNILRDMLGEGATNAAFVPVLSEAEEKGGKEALREAAAACMGAMAVVFGALTVTGMLLMPLIPEALDLLRPFTNARELPAEQVAYTVRLAQWTFPYLFLIGLTAFLMAPLFVVNHYSTPAWAPALLNVALVGACFAVYFDLVAAPAWALVAGVWVGGFAQLGVMYYAVRRSVGPLFPRPRFRHRAVRTAMWLLLPVILGQMMGEVNKLVDTFFAVSLGHVSTLFFANRLVQLPLSVFGVAVSVVILPGLSRLGQKGDYAGVRRTIEEGLRQTFFLILPAMAGLIALAEPLVRLLFQRGAFGPVETQQVAAAVVLYGIGLLSFAWVRVSVQGFFAVQDTKTPVIIASGAMLVSILLKMALVGSMGFRGLPLATSIAFTLNFLFLYAMLCVRFGVIWSREAAQALLRITAAGLVMGVVVHLLAARLELWLGIDGFPAKAATVGVCATLGAALYAGMCLFMRVPEAERFRQLLQRRSA